MRLGFCSGHTRQTYKWWQQDPDLSAVVNACQVKAAEYPAFFIANLGKLCIACIAGQS